MEPLSNIIASRMEAIDMQEQQEDSSELSKSQSTDKPWHQQNIHMGGKLQETMHVPYNLIFKMTTINGRMLLTWKLKKSRNTKYSKIMEMLVMRKIRLVMLPRDIKRSDYI